MLHRQKNKPSFEFTRVPNHRYQESSDPLDDLMQKAFEAPNEPIYKQSPAAAVKNPRSHLNISCSLPSQLSPMNPLTPSPKSVLMLSRRNLTKGYAKFIEEKDFLSHREEERAKVQESVKIACEHADQKIMSEDVQKLISSAIVNEPLNKLKSLRRSADVRTLPNQQLPCLDEKYKKICRRILGNDFESWELFLKTQEEAKLLVQHGRDPIEKANQFENCWKKPKRLSHLDVSMSATLTSTKQKDKVSRKVSALGVPFDLTSVPGVKKEEIIDTLEETESTKYVGEDEGANSSEENSRVPVQLSFNNIENSSLSALNSTVKKSVKNGSLVMKSSILEMSKIKPEMEENITRIVPSNLTSNSKATVRLKLVRRGAKSIAIKENKAPNIMNNKGIAQLVNKQTKEIEKIGQLCNGAIKATQKDGVKLRKRHVQVMKEYNNLDTQMEKLNYDNTVESWEKSVKEVYHIEQTSPFFNLVVL